MDYIKIKPSEIRMFLEDGGRTLVRAGQYELKDGIKNGSRSFILIYHESREVYLIPEDEAQAIAYPFAIAPDIIGAQNAMKTLLSKIHQTIS